MNLLVVVLLGGLWASILLPGLLRGHRSRSPLTTIDSFERSMGILASDRLGTGASSPPGRRVLVVSDPRRLSGLPSRATSVTQRRRRLLTGLACATASTALLAVAVGGIFVALFGLALVATAAYVALLVKLRSDAATRATVRRLPVDRRRSAGRSTAAMGRSA